MKKIYKSNLVRKHEIEQSSDNLGLDADHSSDGETVNNKLNDDNDRITGNPNGESDIENEDDHAIDTPLDQK